MNRKEELTKIFSVTIRNIIEKMQVDFEGLQEIRMRIMAPLLVLYHNREYYVTEEGGLRTDSKDAYVVSKKEIKETVEYISNYSMYAYEEEIRQGYITIQGGHRIGLAGKIIMEKDMVKSMKYISFINVRLSHQVKGCADKVLPYIRNQLGISHTLIISPPRCGKTTLLRDIIRQLSDGFDAYEGITVGVVDERSEIGACYMGVPQNELGIRTDVLDCCPKAKGMLMLIRTMAPQVIAVDEIGSREDIEAIEYVMNCGCKLIATVHGSSVEDVKTKPVLRRLLEERIFERYILLGNKDRTGSVAAVFDAQGNTLYKAGDYCVCL